MPTTKPVMLLLVTFAPAVLGACSQAEMCPAAQGTGYAASNLAYYVCFQSGYTVMTGNNVDPNSPCAGCTGAANLNTRALCENAGDLWTAVNCGAAMAGIPAPSCSYTVNAISALGNTCCSTPATPAATNPCFPSSARVTMADGTASHIGALKEGDLIVAATAEGALTTDSVSLLSISKPRADAGSYVALTTGANKTLTLTAEHHLPVGAECCSALKKAKDVAVGEQVWAAEAGAVSPTRVTAISKAHEKGLHSPVLTHGGFPVVDGLVTSFDSIEAVALAKHGLASLLTACKATGTCAKFRELFLSGDRKYIDELRRR